MKAAEAREEIDESQGRSSLRRDFFLWDVSVYLGLVGDADAKSCQLLLLDSREQADLGHERIHRLGLSIVVQPVAQLERGCGTGTRTVVVRQLCGQITPPTAHLPAMARACGRLLP